MNSIIQSDLQTYLRRLIKENMPDMKSGKNKNSRSPAQNKNQDSGVPLKADNKGENK